MNAAYLSAIMLTICIAFGCQRPLIVDDEQAQTATNWEMVDFDSERLILGLHSTPFEWHAISENQFSRFNSNNELLEKRPLSLNSGVLGQPALSDNTFARLTTEENSQQVLEFHLTKNPAQIWEILVDSLKSPGDSFVEIERLSRTIGAFSSDGTLFLTPIKVLPQRYYALLLFEVLHNAATDEFASIEVVTRINLDDLSSQVANLSNIRFINGNFYVASRQGAWRITPSGESELIFPLAQWMRDFFTHEGKLYATGLSTFDLHESTDNGLTWERLNVNSELELVDTPGDLVLTKTAVGKSYSVAEDDLLKAKLIELPDNASPDGADYYGAVYHKEKYYFSIDRQVYFTSEVIVE